jgi:hypothetical protein
MYLYSANNKVVPVNNYFFAGSVICAIGEKENQHIKDKNTSFLKICNLRNLIAMRFLMHMYTYKQYELDDLVF